MNDKNLSVSNKCLFSEERIIKYKVHFTYLFEFWTDTSSDSLLPLLDVWGCLGPLGPLGSLRSLVPLKPLGTFKASNAPFEVFEFSNMSRLFTTQKFYFLTSEHRMFFSKAPPPEPHFLLMILQFLFTHEILENLE